MDHLIASLPLPSDEPQITQFSAVGPGDSEEFTCYVRPTKPIGKQAQDLTGLTFTNGIMYLEGMKVESVSLKECMEQFIQYLDKR